ncbi:peptidase inhibitor family I36 [Saccharopolyspora erythraea NRRL 2338]|uniref:Uncharacterized protein n=2 Tax=Saccharopolyspora erythraea TaxID=1836 RepID=A4F7K1_SACEN|nr:peptidase inhibitor family I36 protein [Saccharopolyspora erythraea]EQD84272.1 hypothetical protein N599_20870 [Saccharopolyspora erythraea D]PFG93827.1 peptidase inhibitor family I36 [Saccharopolyspora erythraea NRRL 2338]QRK90657.1 peptidase inhibitor family I36 protein [Saccharopolyspora erythraea]CAM00025.1 hypothetical protein SACE_0683 [Saccharopolyspora erythraea NRRL 2338]
MSAHATAVDLHTTRRGPTRQRSSHLTAVPAAPAQGTSRTLTSPPPDIPVLRAPERIPLAFRLVGGRRPTRTSRPEPTPTTQLHGRRYGPGRLSSLLRPPSRPGSSSTRLRSVLLNLATTVLLVVGTALATATAAHAASAEGPATIEPHACPADSFCAWPSHDFQGAAHQTEVSAAPLGRCVALPQDFEATSFANNTGRPVTVYQDGSCSTEADFRTYPTGSFVPRSPYVARAIQVWSH